MVQTPAASEVQIAVSAQDEFTGPVSTMTSKLDNLGSKASTVAAGGIAALAGAAGAMAGKGVDAAKDFEAAMADVQKVTDEATADELSGEIQNLSEEIPLSTTELANLATQAGRFGVEGAEGIGEFTRVAGEMGAATTLSSDEAAQALAKVANATGEPLENVQELGDGINELSNNFATNSQEIVDAAQRGGFSLQNMGLKSDEILGLSAAMNEVFPSSQRAGNAMQRFGEAMMDPDNVSGFAEALGVTESEFRTMREEKPEELIFDIATALEDSDEASQTLADTVSTQQLRAFDRVSEQSDEIGEAMETSNEAMDEGKSLSREVAVETDTLSGQFQLLKSEINNVFINLGEDLLPIVKDGVEGFSEFIDVSSELADDMVPEIGESIEDVAEQFEDFIGQTEGLQEATEDAGDALGSAGSVAQNAVRGNWSAAFDDLERAADSGTDSVRNALVGRNGSGGLVSSFSDGVTSAQQWMQSEGGDAIADGVSALVSSSIDAADDFTDILVGPDGESGVLTAMVDQSVMWLTETLPSLYGDAFQLIGKGIRLGLMDLTNPLRGEDSEIWDMLADGATWTINNLPRLFIAVGEGVVSAIVKGTQGLFKGMVGTDAGEVWNQLKDAGSELEDSATELLGDAGSALGTAIVEGVQGSIDYLTGSGDGTLRGDITSAADQIADAMTEPIEIAWNETVGGTGVNFDGFDISPPDWVPGDASFSWDGFNFQIPKMETGGFVEDVGPALLHPGERVLPETQVSDRGEASFDSSSIANGFDDSQTAQEMQRTLESIDEAIRDDGTVRVRDRDLVRGLQRLFDRYETTV